MAGTRQLYVWLVVVVMTSLVYANEVEVEDSSEKEKAIVPGTKWCGHGDIANYYNDLGILRKTDKCCREHDHCPKNIKAGKKKYGYINEMESTMSHCDCDKKFRRCLHKVKSVDADVVGVGYFVFFQKCFVLNKNKKVKGVRKINY